MSKERKSKRRASSIIARLIGLEVLTKHHQPEHNQQERCSENHKKRRESVGVVGKDTPYDGCSFRKSSKEEQQFKDLFEDAKTKKVVNRNCTVQRNSNTKLTKLHNSKELDNTFEIQDLFLKCFDEPNSLFAKHFHDLQAHPSHSYRIEEGKKASDSANIVTNRPSSHKKYSDSSIKCHYHGNMEAHVKSRRFQFEDEDETCSVPRNIVLLKPKLGNVQTTSEGREAELWGRKNLSGDGGSSKCESKECREITKNITRRKKNSMSASYRDESSSYNSMDNSVNRASFDRKDKHMILSSSTNWEAKERLSERWRMTHRFQELGLVRRSSTLGEMLANSDREIRASICESVNQGVISSKEGWKNGYIKNSSTSLPSSSFPFENPKKSLKSGILCNNIYLMPKEGGENLRSIRRESSSSSNSRSVSQKSKAFRHSDHNNHKSQNILKTGIEKDGPFEQNITTSVVDPMVNVVHETTIVSSESVNYLAERSNYISVEYDYPARDLDKSVTKETSNVTLDEGLRYPSSLVREPECPTSSKEIEQPSPVSVLEAQCQDDDLSSSSDCFVSLTADLQGLRKQLQLLKLESEEYEEGIMAPSSDENFEETATSRFDKNWESSALDDVLFYSSLGNANLKSFITTYNDSTESPLDQSIFQKLGKKYSNKNIFEIMLMFDRINLGLFEISKQFTNPYPWVNVKINALEKRVNFPIGIKDMIEDRLARQEKAANEEDFTEVVVGAEPRWLELEEGVDVIGMELEKVLLDELVLEVLTMYCFLN